MAGRWILNEWRKGNGVIFKNSKIGKGSKVWNYCNIYDSEIGEDCIIGSYCEIGGAKIGNRCKIECGVFIPAGVTIEDNVFIGPHTCFTNDKFPRAVSPDWIIIPTLVKSGASIGANATIRCGIIIGENAMIGCGSVVTKNVPANEVWLGNPAKNEMPKETQKECEWP